MTEQELIEREELLEDILDALEDGDIEEAEDLANDATEQFPQEAFGYFYMGESLFLQTEYEEALENYQKAVELATDNPDYKGRIALMYSKLSQDKEAKRIYEDILENHTEHVTSLIALGVLSLNAYEYPTALDYLNQALTLDTAHIEGYRIRAIVQQSLNNYEASLEDLNNVLAHNAEDTQLWVQKIALHDRLGQEKEAREAFLTWIDLDEDDNSRWVAYAEFLMTKQSYAEAEEKYTVAIEKEIFGDVAAVESFLNRGWARLRQDKLSLAYADFRKVSKLEPQIGQAYMGMAEAKSKMNDLESALLFLDMGIAVVVSDLWTLYDKKGEICTQAQQWDLAKEAYQNNINMPDEISQSEGYYGMGNMYHAKGDTQAAFDWWTKAEASIHLYATNKIETYCQAELKAAIKAKEVDLIATMQADFEANQKSKILATLFGKIWKVDTKATLSNNKILAKMPKEMETVFVPMLQNICFGIVDKGFFALNPGQDGVRMVYTIEKETKENVTIKGIPLDGAEERSFTFTPEGNYTVLTGFGEKEADVKLYMQAVTLQKLPAKTQKALKQERKTGQLDFMGKEFDF